MLLLVSYDFGGGTIDVSVADIDLEHDNAGRITIDAVARGLTGDAYFGGDNITLKPSAEVSSGSAHCR